MKRGTASIHRQRLDQRPAQACRYGPVGFEDLLLGVTDVAAENLVAAVARKHHADTVRMRHPGAQVRGHRRRVAERLVVRCRYDRNSIDDILRRDVVLVRLGRKVSGSYPRILHFVEPVGREADGVCTGRAAAHFGEKSRYRRAVGASAQERADVGISTNGAPDGFAQQLSKPFLEFGERCIVVVVVMQMPIEPPLQRTVSKAEALARLQFLDALVDRAGAWHHVAIEIVEDGLMAETASYRRMRGNAVGGRTEDELSRWIGITHGANAQPVDCKQRVAAFEIDNCKGTGTPISCRQSLPLRT